MKVKCPNCASVGRVPDNRIPEQGANIRCPSCSFVFFIGGPDATNVVADSDGAKTGSLPAMGRTQSLPTANPNQLRDQRAAIAAAQRGAAEQARNDSTESEPTGDSAPAAPDDSSSSGSDASDSSAVGPRQSEAPAPPTATPPPVSSSTASSPAPPPGDSNPGSPSDSGLGSRRKAEIDYEKAVQAVLSQHTGSNKAVPSSRYSMSTPMAGNESVSKSDTEAGSSTLPGASSRPAAESAAPAPASPPKPEPEPTPEPAPEAAAAPEPEPEPAAPARPVAQQLHKVRAASGIVYDFHNEDAVRKWLVTRGSFDDLAYSPDGGQSYVPVAAVEEFSDLSPGGLRTRSGSLPAITADVVAARRLSEPVEHRPEDLTSTGRVRTIKPSTSKSAAVPDVAETAASGEKAKKIPVWRAALYVLLATLAALAAAYAFAPADRSIQIPDTPAGEQLQWVMTTIHGQSGALNLGIIGNHIVADQVESVGPALIERLQYIDQWRDEITITALPIAEDGRIVALLTTDRADDGWILIECQPNTPNLINRMEFGRGAPPPNILR